MNKSLIILVICSLAISGLNCQKLNIRKLIEENISNLLPAIPAEETVLDNVILSAYYRYATISDIAKLPSYALTQINEYSKASRIRKLNESVVNIDLNTENLDENTIRSYVRNFISTLTIEQLSNFPQQQLEQYNQIYNSRTVSGYCIWVAGRWWC